MLLGNTAQIEITPALGTVINGEFTCRYANHIADPLYAKAIYLKDEAVQSLFIVVDICVMKREFLDPIKEKIFESTGVLPSNQMISSTHTHSGGSVADLLMAHVDINYRKFLEIQLLALAVLACESCQAIKVAYGKLDKPEHLTCRRYKLDGSYVPINPVLKTVDLVKTNPFGLENLILSRTSEPDPELCFMALKTLDNQWLGLLANYGLHYVGDCERGTVTADYFGYFANHLKGLLGAPEMVAIMSNGTSGEVNIWDFIHGDRYPTGKHEKSKLIGEDLAKAVVNVCNELHWDEHADLAVSYTDVLLAKRPIAQERLQQAKEVVAVTDFEGLTYQDMDLMEKVYAREQLLLESVPDTIAFPVQGIRIGKIIIGALGGEFFSASGKTLKTIYPQYFSICMANDYVGYVPPDYEFENGGYETWRCRGSFLVETAESDVLKKLSSIITKLVKHEN